MTTNTDSIPVVPAVDLARILPSIRSRSTASTGRHADHEREQRERDWLRRARLMQGFMIR